MQMSYVHLLAYIIMATQDQMRSAVFIWVGGSLESSLMQV